MATLRFYRLLLALMVVATTGCAGLRDASVLLSRDRAGAASPTAATASSFPRGRFRSMVTPDLLLLVIDNAGGYQVYFDMRLMDTGSFLVDGTNVTVDSLHCGEAGIKPAQYAWIYGEEDLEFRALGEDPCSERRQYLADDYEYQFMFVDLPFPAMPGRSAHQFHFTGHDVLPQMVGTLPPGA